MFISCLPEQVEVPVWCVASIPRVKHSLSVLQKCVFLLMKQPAIFFAPGSDVEPAGHLQPINLPELFSHA